MNEKQIKEVITKLETIERTLKEDWQSEELTEVIEYLYGQIYKGVSI